MGSREVPPSLEAPSGRAFTAGEAPALLFSSNTEKQVLYTHGLPRVSAKGAEAGTWAQVWTQVKGDFLFPLAALGTCPQHR